jgi:pyruvate/2-oxoglutarate dehydrogenase complex dihydrolipoamide acyltransferase (E2) component
VEHRKNLSPRKTYVPSSWIVLLTALVCLGGAGWLGWLLVDDGSEPEPAASPTPSTTTSATPTTTPTTAKPSPTTTATKKPTPTPTASATPEVARDVPVSVLNNSGVTGAARAYSARVAQAGWPLGGIGNWTGSIPSTTVYYPAAYEAQARLLARDLGINRVMPAVSPMRTDRLTIILSGPQS